MPGSMSPKVNMNIFPVRNPISTFPRFHRQKLRECKKTQFERLLVQCRSFSHSLSQAHLISPAALKRKQLCPNVYYSDFGKSCFKVF